MVNTGAEWDLTGYIFYSNIDKIERIKIVFNNSEYEMQFCYFEPILQKFALRIDDEMNPKFDYLSRYEELEEAMKLKCNSVMEQELKEENDNLKEQVRLLKEGIEIMRKAVNDAHLRQPTLFWSV